MRRPSFARLVPLAFVAACGGGSSPANPDAGVDAGATPDAGVGACVDPDAPLAWPVPTAPIEVPADPSWKGSITLDDGFLTSTGFTGNEPSWVKFSVLLRDPTKVYFQDSNALRFHYEFATAHLPPLVGLSPEAFDAVSLHAEGQEVVLGAVLVPPAGATEFGVQLVGLDTYAPAFVKTIFDLVVAQVEAPAGTRALYLPVPEQTRCLGAHGAWLEAHGVPVASADRWLDGNACYAGGWTVGRLVASTAATLEDDYVAGVVTAADVVLLADAAPAEVPPIAGLLTLAASTPNSHTAILAQAYGMPFAYLRLAEVAAQAEALVGRTIVVGTRPGWDGTGGCEVTLIDVTDVPPADLAAIRARRAPAPIAYPAKVARGVIAVDVDAVGRADAATVGGKAANYGLLRDVIPAAAPRGVALTFDLWDAFLDQVLPAGGTLRAAVGARLAGHAWPPDMLALDADLDAVRELVRDGATWTPAQADAIAAALAGFDPARRLRFRSSTNVEDGDTFVGAGLYESYTGCLADDLDGDAAGPSACNPADAEERSALRAIRRTYASFYRRNAVLERLRRGVDEAEVGMAVLVTYSYPDEDEAANGVATLARWESGASDYDTVTMVTQVGATSVANPEDGSLPEVVVASVTPYGTSLETRATSTLVPLGEHVLPWQAGYEGFLALFDPVADAWGPGSFTLDLEYKRLVDETLIVKQVRVVPAPDTTVDVTPYLASAPRRYCVFQGEAGDVWGIHHAKSVWTLTSHNRWLDAAGLATTLLRDVEATVLDGAAPVTQAGAPTSFAAFAHEFAGDATSDRLRVGSAPGRFAVALGVTPLVARNARPVHTLDDLYVTASVTWDAPRWAIDYTGVVSRSEDFVALSTRCPDDPLDTTGLPRVTRTLTDGAVTVATAYFWPEAPGGISAGYTAPLVKWDGTTITGLTTAPITLAGYWSQSHRPGHHNFTAEYIFEPRLEPGVAAATLAELEAADVRALYVEEGFDGATMWIVGLDGTLRQL